MNTKKHIHFFSLYLLLAVPLLFTVSSAFAVDASYYSSLNGKKDSELRSALTVLLFNHHIYYDKYDGPSSGTENWDFPFDYDPNTGYVWDIYTTGCNAPANIGSSGSCCCTGLNREHLVCQSTFGGSTNKDKVPEYADRHSLFLTDAYTNQRRNDQAFGEVDKTKTTSKGSCEVCNEKAMGMLGTVGTFADLYESTEDIYEPGDEYKGDIARAILYMVVRYAERQYNRLPDGARYNNSKTGVGDVVSSALTTASEHEVTTWKNKGTSTAATIGQMFSTDLNVNYGLSAYGKAILLKWHRQDPVSQKEIDRNAGVEAVQGNRNPFVDYPCLVEYIWGEHTGENFSTANVVGSFESGFTGEGCTASTTPTLTVSTSSVTIGPTASGESSTKTFTVTGVNLTGNITITRTSGSGFFTVSPSSIAAASANGTTTITITYHPTSTGNHNAVFTIASSGATSLTVNVSGSCAAVYTATWMANGVQFHQNSTTAGVAPAMPGDAPDDCSATRVFVGWTAETAYSGDSEPADLFTAAAPVISGNTTFYAVYADQTASGTPSLTNKYAKITSTSDLTTGNYLVVGDNSGYYAMSNAMKGSSTFRIAPTQVYPSSDTIADPSASVIWRINVSGTKVSFYNETSGKHVYVYMSGTYKNMGLTTETTDIDTTFTASVAAGAWTFTSQTYTDRIIEYFGSGGYFTLYGSADKSIYLYKQVMGSGALVLGNYSTSCSASCTRTITATSSDEAKGTAAVALP